MGALLPNAESAVEKNARETLHMLISNFLKASIYFWLESIQKNMHVIYKGSQGGKDAANQAIHFRVLMIDEDYCRYSIDDG